MKRVVIHIPDEIADELNRRSHGVGKRRLILEALCKDWGWPTHDLPEDQRIKGTDAYIARKEFGWHENAENPIGRPKKKE